jgi:hypothetical protein
LPRHKGEREAQSWVLDITKNNNNTFINTLKANKQERGNKEYLKKKKKKTTPPI